MRSRPSSVYAEFEGWPDRFVYSKRRPRDEARATLAEIYRLPTESFDSADLKDAKALLDKLKP